MGEAMRADAGMRLARAGVLSVVCVALSAVAHALASHRAVPPGALAAALPFAAAFTVPLVGRERTARGVAVILLCGQVLTHVVFSAGQCGMDASATAGSRPVSGHAGMGAGWPFMPSPTMFVLHLAAALAFGLVLRRGGAALWALVRLSERGVDAVSGFVLSLLLAVVALVSVRAPLVFAVRRAGRAEVRGGRGTAAVLAHAVVRRGPPRRLAAV
ncbi:hypothetical protein BTM25_43030 [Actinomadura rubteroloni]|uniref:Integral membrane protein n=1 Tax=Actinomadura rubteroloni TaxID=1926885 RepID=A0A2P4UDP5_9ACTN|nr:hypothetical protein [Actinomadura rubteroloni]POM23151.1 hypothetical protein BTM25_43030 [Actinomadura rubteroloni]